MRALVLLGLLALVAACSGAPPNDPVPRPPIVFFPKYEWQGASVYIATDRNTNHYASLVESALKDEANFIVVGTPEQAALVLYLSSGGSSFSETGSVGAVGYSRFRGPVDAKATWEGKTVAQTHVDLEYTVTQRGEESWAEFEQREKLEKDAADHYVAAVVVDAIVTKLPPRSTVAHASASAEGVGP